MDHETQLRMEYDRGFDDGWWEHQEHDRRERIQGERHAYAMGYMDALHPEEEAIREAVLDHLEKAHTPGQAAAAVNT